MKTAWSSDEAGAAWLATHGGTLRAAAVGVLIVTTLAALWATRVVTIPLALSLFIVVLAWPLQRRLERSGVPRGAGYAVTLLAVLLVVSIFGGILFLCAKNVAAKAPEYDERLVSLQHNVWSWLESKGVTMSAGESATGGEGQSADGPGGITLQSLLDWVGPAFAWSYAFLGQVVLVVTFTVLGLVEAHRLSEKLGKHLRPKSAEMIRDVGDEVGSTLQRYMVVRTAVSAATGLLVGFYTWAIGLDFPLVWGVSSFLLNYIPMLGSIVAVFPPSVFALVHPEGWVFFATLAGLTVIQFTIGNFVDPRLEGRILSLSPFVLFFSIIFWGWLWGIPGALLGIPLTASLVIVCRKFEPTHGLAGLLTK